MFLVHLLDDLTPEPRRPELYALGRELIRRSTTDGQPPADRDPAVLAFAGLTPDQPTPMGPTAAALRKGLRHRVSRWADDIVGQLRARLRDRIAEDATDHHVLTTVIARRGDIVADPGWFDVELALDEVTLPVRAAGLDTDPGWVPALGCVVRFRYV
jgi:hypothetical protein